MKCELCDKKMVEGYDGRELAKVMGIRRKDDPDQFPLCQDCYNDLERAIATAWLSKIVDGEKDGK